VNHLAADPDHAARSAQDLGTQLHAYEVRERCLDTPEVCFRLLDEDVDVIGVARMPVERDRVAADDEVPDAVRVQGTNKLAVVLEEAHWIHAWRGRPGGGRTSG
jgi:hypothetical protein